MVQNTSHAVMAQRHEPADSLDNFPTPPWATRALMDGVLIGLAGTDLMTCLEPACGQGHMAKPLLEYFSKVTAFDIHSYGYGDVGDFLNAPIKSGAFDWVITNPPFRLAEQFIEKSLDIAADGVAMLVRTSFFEGVGRYERIFSKRPPSYVAQFSERVPMVKGRLDRTASTATAYAWAIWMQEDKNILQSERMTRFCWISPCRKRLERETDYIASPNRGQERATS